MFHNHDPRMRLFTRMKETDVNIIDREDARLLTFLVTVTHPKDAMLAFAAWLKAIGDPRGPLVRELAYARCQLPACLTSTRKEKPLAIGDWWCIVLEGKGVSYCVYDDYPLTEIPEIGGEGTNVGMVKLPAPYRTAEAVLRAFEDCRREMICSLFGYRVGDVGVSRLLTAMDTTPNLPTK